jgi:hypothetical protein
MDRILDETLVKSFPLLYRDRYGDMSQTAMCWGFPKRGWFLILWNLSEKLEKLIQTMPEAEREHCRASQCKEKYGRLELYCVGATNEMQMLIDEASDLSLKTCEECGEPGVLREARWLITACDRHSKGRPPYQEEKWEDDEQQV